MVRSEKRILLCYPAVELYSPKNVRFTQFFFFFITSTVIALIAINAFIVINISYEISINYCSIKIQIVIILRKILNTALSSVRSVSILKFSEHFQLIFDNSNVNSDKRIKQKLSANFSGLSNISSSSF